MAVTSFKFIFHLYLGKLTLATSLECEIGATWKRSNETAKSQMAHFSKGFAMFDQTLSLPVNMYFDSNTSSFQQKKSQLTFTLHTEKGDKSAGVVIIDLAIMLNNKLEVINDKLTLEKCPDKNAKIQIKLTCQSKGQHNPSEASVAGPLDVTNVSTISLPAAPIQTVTYPIKVTESKSSHNEQQLAESVEEQNQRLKKQVSFLKSQQISMKQQHKKQIEKLNSQIVSIRNQLNRSKTNQQTTKNQYLQLKNQHNQQQKQYKEAKKRLEMIYEQFEQYI